MPERIRFMRILVLFDLPIETRAERRIYAKFRKYLIKNGFYMLQKSVYCKMVLNGSNAEAVKKNLRHNRPDRGLVQVLLVTEKQFVRMECITGESSTDVLSDTRTRVNL